MLTALGHAIAGASGTALSNVLLYPLDLVITRLQVQQKSASRDEDDDTHYDNLKDAVRKIYVTEGGTTAFYSGITQDTIKSVIDSFIFFLAYNLLQRARSKKRNTSNNPTLSRLVDEIGIGVIAGAFTRGLTAPMQQIVTRKQTAAMSSASKSSNHKPHIQESDLSVRKIAKDIYKAKGLTGFWAGYSATLVLTLNPSLTFYTDSFLRRLLKIGETSGPLSTFLVAATGKALASSVTYPISLAKSRAQAFGAEAAGVPDSKAQQTSISRPANVLMSVPEIARSNGIGALYAGLSLEVLKGFFSHGLTMLVKQRLHSLVIKLYFLLVKLAQRSRDASRAKHGPI